jgi:hypothetical protein
LPEGEELFQVRLSSAVGAKIVQNTTTIRITDDDRAGLFLVPLTNFTGEDGAGAELRVTLTLQPVAPVTVHFSSSDPSEGTVGEQLVFTPQNWNVAQSIFAAGVDDTVDDGDIAYTITAALSSVDPAYAAVSPVTVTMTNRDNEGIKKVYLPLVAP